MKTATIGTIIHGTLQTSDILPALMEELERIALINGETLSLPQSFPLRDKIAETLGEAQDCFVDSNDTIPEDKEEEAMESIESLMEMLEEFAPPFCRFGAHEGNGSDFGFWPDFEAIREFLPDAESVGEDFAGHSVEVNDHGNMMLLEHDGDGNRKEVWSIV